MNSRDAFAELRARLQQRPDRRLRDEVFGLIDRFWQDADAEERARFADEHMEYLDGHLERNWPVELRTWTLGGDGEGSLLLARTMRIVHPMPPYPTDDYMARIDQVFALTPDDVAHLDGLELIGLGTNHSHTIEHVLEIFGPLTRVEVYTNQQPVALFDTLAARHAATMTRVGLGHLPSYRGASLDNEDVDQVCGRMREHFDDQRGLEGLTLHDTVGSQPGAHAWLPDLLAHPATHALDTLSVGVRADVFDPKWLKRWGGVHGLRRLHVRGLAEQHRQELSRSPELVDVELWNLSSGHEDVWIDDETDAWTELIRRGPGAIEARDLDLQTMSGVHLERLLLHANGELRARVELESLSLKWPTSGILDALLVEGTEALPKLAHLRLETRLWETPEHHADVGESGLCDQLDTLEWVRLDVPRRFDTPHEQHDDIERWCRVATTTRLHPRMRRRAWRKLLDGCGHTLTHLQHLGLTVGLDAAPKMGIEELRSAFEAMVPQREGG